MADDRNGGPLGDDDTAERKQQPRSCGRSRRAKPKKITERKDQRHEYFVRHGRGGETSKRERIVGTRTPAPESRSEQERGECQCRPDRQVQVVLSDRVVPAASLQAEYRNQRRACGDRRQAVDLEDDGEEQHDVERNRCDLHEFERWRLLEKVELQDVDHLQDGNEPPAADVPLDELCLERVEQGRVMGELPAFEVRIERVVARKRRA